MALHNSFKQGQSQQPDNRLTAVPTAEELSNALSQARKGGKRPIVLNWKSQKSNNVFWLSVTASGAGNDAEWLLQKGAEGVQPKDVWNHKTTDTSLIQSLISAEEEIAFKSGSRAIIPPNTSSQNQENQPYGPNGNDDPWSKAATTPGGAIVLGGGFQPQPARPEQSGQHWQSSENSGWNTPQPAPEQLGWGQKSTPPPAEASGGHNNPFAALKGTAEQPKPANPFDSLMSHQNLPQQPQQKLSGNLPEKKFDPQNGSQSSSHNASQLPNQNSNQNSGQDSVQNSAQDTTQKPAQNTPPNPGQSSGQFRSQNQSTSSTSNSAQNQRTSSSSNPAQNQRTSSSSNPAQNQRTSSGQLPSQNPSKFVDEIEETTNPYDALTNSGQAIKAMPAQKPPQAPPQAPSNPQPPAPPKQNKPDSPSGSWPVQTASGKVHPPVPNFAAMTSSGTYPVVTPPEQALNPKGGGKPMAVNQISGPPGQNQRTTLKNAPAITPPSQSLTAPAKQLPAPVNLDRKAVDGVFKTLSNPETGLLNHASMLFFLVREFSRYQVNNEPFSLIILEMSVLASSLSGAYTQNPLPPLAVRGAAQRVLAITRQLDLISHYEDNDYAILLPATNRKQANDFAQNVAKALLSQPLTPDMDPKALVLRMGVASFPEDTSHPGILLAAAAEAKSAANKLNKPIVLFSET